MADMAGRLPSGFAAPSDGFILKFEDLTIGPVIGGGAFSKVYRGEFKGGEVAIKAVSVSKDIGKYITSELAILAGVNHPNLMRYHGACVTDSLVYVVTELMRGGDLATLVNSPAELSWHTKVSLAHDVIKGIAYLHEQDILHRDIKTENVLLRDDWVAVLSDYGFARRKAVAANMTICGTDEYMAPELLFGENYDDKADVFSFGVVLAHIATRRQPGVDGFLQRTAPQKFAIDFDALRTFFPADCPAQLVQVCVDCLTYEPDCRLDAAGAAELLQGLLEETPNEPPIPAGLTVTQAIAAAKAKAGGADAAPPAVEEEAAAAVEEAPVSETVMADASVSDPEPAPAAVAEPATTAALVAVPGVLPEHAHAVAADAPVVAQSAAPASEAVAVEDVTVAEAAPAPTNIHLPVPATAAVSETVIAPAVVAEAVAAPVPAPAPAAPAPAAAKGGHSHSHGGHGHSHDGHGHSHGKGKKCVVQ